jgi:glycosyltransferase involved in cell wall biosynthesis
MSVPSRPVRLAYVTTLPITQFLFLRGQNAYMAAHGFELHAVCSPGPLLDRLAERDGVHPHPVPISRRISPREDAATLLRLYRLFRRIRPDVVHLSTPKAALLGALAARAAGVPVRIFYLRGTAAESATGPTRELFRRLEALTARLCTARICVSPSLLRFAREEGILGPGEGTVVASGMSNGVDAERFAAADAARDPHAPPVIGFVGRLARDKGIEELAGAWSVLRDRFPAARLLLVGWWESEDPVSPECRAALEADPRVELAGRTEDVVPFLARMSVFAYPSHGTEGFPNGPMEAAAAGLPVVASAVVGCVDAVVEGQTGALVPARDAAALAEALAGYLADPERARAHGRAGRDRARRDFRPEGVWAALLAEYRRLLHQAGIAPPRGAAMPAPAEQGGG